MTWDMALSGQQHPTGWESRARMNTGTARRLTRPVVGGRAAGGADSGEYLGRNHRAALRQLGLHDAALWGADLSGHGRRGARHQVFRGGARPGATDGAALGTAVDRTLRGAASARQPAL